MSLKIPEKPDFIFFDLDTTLTRSRSPILDDHAKLFAKLCSLKEVSVISGANSKQMDIQLGRSGASYHKLSQYGNHVILKNGETLWCEGLSELQCAAVYEFIEAIRRHLNLQVKDEGDIIQERGVQIGFSLIGHNEDRDKKYAFDPDRELRSGLLKKFEKRVTELSSLGILTCVAGTTSIDFMRAGQHKGFNIGRVIEKMGWDKNKSLYIGDQLTEGGNDETVIGVIPTRGVSDPEDTFSFVRDYLLF